MLQLLAQALDFIMFDKPDSGVDVKNIELIGESVILSDNAEIDTIPELKATRKDLDLSHEAAVGKIAEEEIQ